MRAIASSPAAAAWLLSENCCTAPGCGSASWTRPSATTPSTEIYREGLEAGALGGKLLGAGGGGFLLFFVPPDRRAAVQARLGHLQQIDFQVNAPGTQVVHSDSAPGPIASPALYREAA